MKINIKELQNREKYISCQKHDTLPLLIWNYTPRAQFEKVWDEYITQARGLITDLEGEIISRPFRKFFNLNEKEETTIENLPSEVPEITEKLDGSLGIQYYAQGNVCIATRGSFNSDQAKWATEWIQKWMVGRKADFLKGYTYLYEIIYPENRIVVDYGGRKELVLLAVVETETGDEIDHIQEAERLGLSYSKPVKKSVKELSEGLETLDGNDEGFVVKYSNGLRLKMKGKEYVRLHRLITGFSTKSIWECLMNNEKFDDVLDRVPDEFYDWVSEKKKELELSFMEVKRQALDALEKTIKIFGRKEQALYIVENHKEISDLVFGLLDGKDINVKIWRRLKPKWELPFKADGNF